MFEILITLFMLVIMMSLVGCLYFIIAHADNIDKYEPKKLFLLVLYCGPMVWVTFPLMLLFSMIGDLFTQYIHNPLKVWLNEQKK